MGRRLDFPPIVECIFEVRWATNSAHPDLLNEYEVSLGQLYQLYKTTHFRQTVFQGPKEIFRVMPAHGIIFDRFLPRPEKPEHQYPLYQYGPGVATFNMDKNAYNWNEFLKKSVIFFDNLNSVHDDFKQRISQLSLRTIDLFPGKDVNNFLQDGLGIQIKTPLDTMHGLNIEESIPAYFETWIIPEKSSKLNVSARPGIAGDAEGILLDLNYSSEHPDVSDGVENLLKIQHKICGDAFFELLQPSLREELGFHESI